MFDFLPEEYRKKAFIAGGWAACPAMATDRDVWITIDSSDADWYEKFRDLKQHLESRALFYTVDFATPLDRDYPDNTQKVADLIYPWEKVQLLMTHLEPEEVLKRFDISTHQIAITSDGRIIKGEQWTPVTEIPQLIKGNTHRTTPGRIKKICNRYGFGGGIAEAINAPGIDAPGMDNLIFNQQIWEQMKGLV